MKKLLSALLSLTMITALASTAFAAEPSTAEYAFSNDVVYAEISNGDLNTYSNSSIIVMTKEQASELGTKLQDIAMSCELVYITNATDTSEIAEIAGLPAPGLAVSTAPEKTQTIAVAIDNIDGDLFIKNISVISDDIDALLNTSSRQSNTVLLDGIEAALNEDEVINVTPNDSATPYALPSGQDNYSYQSANVYDSSNNKVGAMRFTAYYYDHGYTRNGYLFDTIVRATFAPDTSHYLKLGAVTLGHTYTDEKSITIIDQTRIPTSGSSTTYELGFGIEDGSLNIGPSVSWNYDSDAMTVTNSFSEEDRRIWYFEPKKINTGDAVVQEPGIRSTSSTKASQYTTVNMHCPIYNFLGLIVGSNDMGYHIYWN